MSFKPFNFSFTPPLTVQEPTPASTAPVSTVPTVGGPTSGAQSRAGQIISKLDDLTAMAQYLQDAIVTRTGRTAIEINPAVDPNTARALTSIYSTDTPPTFITVSMYDQLLDAHMGALQLEMMVGNNSTIQANPFQVGDLMTLINTIDGHLIDNPSYNNWLPLYLATLKGDSIIFQSWKASLATYPAFYASQPLVPSDLRLATISAASLDLDHDLFEYEDSVVTRYGQSYSNVYQAMASVSAVERDINSVMIEYFYQPLQNMLRIVGLFNALSGFAHKTSMSNIQGDLVNYAFIRLASDTTSMLHTCDQLVALSVAPLSGTLGSLGRIVAGVQQQAAVFGFLAGGGLAGLSKNNACATSNPSNKIKGGKPLNIPGLGEVSEGLKHLGEMLDWSMRESEKGLSLVDKSFRQLIERRMKQQDDKTQLMCSIRALDTLAGIANGVVKELQKGTVTPDSSPQQKQEAAGRILTSLQTGTNTTFTSESGQIIVNPPDMPPAPDAVNRVLKEAKIHTTVRSIQS